jgi:superfamily II DNA/RNA helicase
VLLLLLLLLLPLALLLLQAFHALFHTDESVLLGAPTGSGKTISSELTMMRLWDAHPGDKVRSAARRCCCGL